jgi:hypothetical protein
MLRWFQFWVAEDVITRSRTASGHVDGAADDASTAKIDGWRERGYARLPNSDRRHTNVGFYDDRDDDSR